MGAFRLASLALEGFKSFASPVELTFPGSIIAIVGPNGSGKSNVCDAIAWVLGEQSARLLRSQTMADVIFSGSTRRTQSGAAVVTLTLAASDGRWVETEGRLQISRRVLRDGTSDYRIGGKRARLKDVVDRLVDAGLGTRAYAIIEQGRIGQVLSARSIERRALFEEAAGITKFRMRRHEAELKLAETRANLLRLADVASEVRRALEAARRQARRAERALALRDSLAEVRAALLGARRALLTAELEARRASLVDANATEAAAAAAAGAAEATLERVRRELDAAQDTLAATRAEGARADASAARREAEEAAARREHDDAGARRQAAIVEAQRLAAEGREEALREVELIAAVTGAEAAAASDERLAQAAGEAARTSEQTARGASAKAEEARRALLSGVAAATEARNRAHRTDVELEQARYQRSRTDSETVRLKQHLAQAAERQAEAARGEASAGERVADTEQARRALREQGEALTTRIADTTAERDRIGHELWQVRHERDGLARSLASARALPQALARALPEREVLGSVADFLDPEPGAAALLDRAWGELLRLPVVESEDAARRLLDSRKKVDGRLEVAIAGDALPVDGSPLLERAGAQPEALGWLTRTLPRAALAESIEQGRELADGDAEMIVLLPDGARRRGRRLELPGAVSGAPGVLELRTRERAAAGRQKELEEREAALVAELESSRAAFGALSARISAADADARAAAEKLAVATSTHEALRRESGRLERELEALAGEAARLDEEVASLAQRQIAAAEEAQRLAARAEALETDVDSLARAADSAQREAAGRRAEAERAQGAAALSRERLLAARRELERHSQNRAELGRREQAARTEEAAQAARADAAAAAAAAARADLEELLARRAAAGRAVEVQEAAERELRERVTASADDAQARRAAHLAARDGAHAARLAVTEVTGELGRLDDTAALTLGDRPLPDSPPPAAELPALEARERELAGELEALGPVNELAVAEREELEERHRFLNEQRRDLERSLESLQTTVHELDVTCAERFVATLGEASTAFDELFRHLFGGGEAHVELSDPDSPLDSGVEIRVRPPGKHIQSVLLLSGGEKALAAVALLLALFRIRPAPFCVLDEVDAPLDDANVERLCRLLRTMSAETQFLLVTHNRRTMAHADVLYGVTMPEPGVSRIVSVRLED